LHWSDDQSSQYRPLIGATHPICQDEENFTHIS
jgi:hypothetical protein